MIKSFTLIIILNIFIIATMPSAGNDISITDLQKHIGFLASDSLKGRKPGSAEDKLSAAYIRDCMKNGGLELLYDDGYQNFPVLVGIEAGKNNRLNFNGYEGKTGTDFLPIGFSSDTTVSADVVFVGWGFDIKTKLINWNDYESVDVTGKWVMTLMGEPKTNNVNIRYDEYSTMRAKALTAKDKKAAGIIFVSRYSDNPNDILSQLTLEDSRHQAGIPAVQVSRNLADRILSRKATTIRDIETAIDSEYNAMTFETGERITITTEIVKKEETTQNIVGLLIGSDKNLKDEYIVVGAHCDHLGFGGPGSGSRMPDTAAIHNGADDNASGTATMLELIDYFKDKKPKRNIIFVAFSAEEMGTLGSKKFVNSAPVDLKSIKFMCNFDMIGRIDSVEKILTLTGTGTGQGLDSIVRRHEDGSGLKLALMPEGAGPSDQSSFYAKNIPVLNFFGKAHLDYHTPFDDIEKINLSGLKSITQFAASIISDIANMAESLIFSESGPKTIAGGNRAGLKVTLGIMPDFSASDITGLRVEVVTPGKPAARAGMKNGDIIIAIEGKSINNIYDYTFRMKQFKSGDRISIDLLRNGKREILIVEL